MNRHELIAYFSRGLRGAPNAGARSQHQRAIVVAFPITIGAVNRAASRRTAVRPYGGHRVELRPLARLASLFVYPFIECIPNGARETP